MPTSHTRRREPCSHCHDVVLVAERVAKSSVGGVKRAGKPEYWLEHADPSPDGEVFDPVDDGCRRRPVA